MPRTYPFGEVMEEAAMRFLLPAMAQGVAARRRFLSSADARTNASSNVHGIGIGYKTVSNVATDRLAVRFHVIQKLPTSLLNADWVLPPSIGNLPTDVIESVPALLGGVQIGRMVEAAVPPQCSPTGGPAPVERFKCYRPLAAGIAIGHPLLSGEGTLGWFCRSTVPGEEDLRFLLSARHVLALLDGKDHTGDPVFQPQIQGTSVAKVSRATPLAIGPHSNNTADAAIGRLLDNNVQLTIVGLGRPGSPADPAPNMAVVKRGVATLVTHGVISDYPYAQVVTVNTPAGSVCLFQNQIRIQSPDGAPIADGGDSGALILREADLAPVGLLFAQPDNVSTIAFASPISTILEALQIVLL